jgi:uncharacterized protein (DUF3084 family)
MKQRAESAEKKLGELAKIHDQTISEFGYRIECLQKKLSDAGRKMETERQACDLRREQVSELRKELNNREEKARKMQEVIDRQEAEKEQMALEIMKLKARLYDLTVA